MALTSATKPRLNAKWENQGSALQVCENQVCPEPQVDHRLDIRPYDSFVSKCGSPKMARFRLAS